MDDWVLRIPMSASMADKAELLLTREWLVTNGLGGYASGSLAGVSTRRYHSLLVAALPAPFGRRVMLNHLSELIRVPGGASYLFGGEEREDRALKLHGAEFLSEFRLECGLPVWRYEVNGVIFEKRILLPYRQNTVHINYHLVAGESIRLKLRPSVHFRSHDAPVNENQGEPYVVSCVENRYEIAPPSDSGSWQPALRLYLHGKETALTLESKTLPGILYRVEEDRGYDFLGTLWSPGYFRVTLSQGQQATLVASSETWETILSLQPEEAHQAELERRERLVTAAPPELHSGYGRELVLAADQFVITPSGRIEDAARAHAAGDEIRTVIAGYHWFTDWGRDTMICLEGLTLTTGRHLEAGYLLRTFAHYVRDGLIPNVFPEGQKEGLYHTADATLWYFHALDRYLKATKDKITFKLLLPILEDIVKHHLEGTRFGIGVDPHDGLLKQGAEGYQLTWMDAKVGDWVVTPRRGKAVEINALWYNALRLLERWVSQQKGEHAARVYREHADRAAKSFNKRFWYASGQHLYDVVDGEQGDDPACRPNQVMAISLDYPVLDPAHWKPVLDVVTQRLLTPVGLRSLAPGHPDYKAQYYGDLRSRDAAYHQGTVWAWLIGPYIDAFIRVYPEERSRARRFLKGLAAQLGDACIGSISEVFDAEEPYTPRGCVAQAWSVAEVIRCWALTSSK